MSPKRKARLAFASALILLLFSGVAASVTVVRLLKNEDWVAHTYDVQLTLSGLQSSIAVAARARAEYGNSGDLASLRDYDPAKTQVQQKLSHVTDLVRDNPIQQALESQLTDAVLRRLVLMDEAIQLRKAGKFDEDVALRWSRENVAAAAEFSNVMQEMLEEEQRLLTARRKTSGGLFTRVLGILATMLVLAIVLFWIHYRLLSKELTERERMEVSARHLSARVLQLQDEERRKFSRELHDSLGQLLAMAKMHLSVLLEKNPHDELLAEIDKLLNDSVTETRTISHLLHPPLLDEMGFGSAARWYVEGYARRSGIQVAVDIADNVGRLPRPMELALFRVLQESLTNIHRHAKSPKADMSLRARREGIVLRVRDYGQGMPRETLQHFLDTGTHVGVGLAGIRERIREQGGQLEIESDRTGTTITVTMPMPATEPPPKRVAAASAD